MFRRIPDKYICPLSEDQAPMQDPVIYNGTTYERQNIVKFLSSEGKNDVLLVPNHKMKRQINDWLQSLNANQTTAASASSSSAEEPSNLRVIGRQDGYVGKKHLIRLVGDASVNGQDDLMFSFINHYNDFYSKGNPITSPGDYTEVQTCVMLNEEQISLHLYSVNSTQRVTGMSKSQAFPVTMLVFDVTNKESFDEVSKQAKILLSRQGNFGLHQYILLVGNTVNEGDKSRVISRSYANGFVHDAGLNTYLEVTVKDANSLDELFTAAVLAAKSQADSELARDEDKKLFKIFKSKFKKETSMFSNRDVLKCESFILVIYYAKANPQSVAAKIVNEMKEMFIVSPSIRNKM